MDDYYLKKQLVGEVQEAIKIKELNIELIEHLGFMGTWLINYCIKNKIEPPNLEKLQELIQKSRFTIQQMNQLYPSDETLHRDKNSSSDEDRPEPYKWFCQVIVGYEGLKVL